MPINGWKSKLLTFSLILAVFANLGAIAYSHLGSSQDSDDDEPCWDTIKWHAFGKYLPGAVEEKRLKRFWNDYHRALQQHYPGLEHVDWVTYYKSPGIPVNAAPIAEACLADEKQVNPEVKASATISRPDAAGNQLITLNIQINKDWYIYANPVKNNMDVFQKNQTAVQVQSQGGLGNVKIQFPAGEVHEDFGQKYMIYQNNAVIQIAVQRVGASPVEVDLAVSTCHVEGRCLKRAQVKFTLP